MANSQKHPCRCCGHKTMSSPAVGTYEICPVCYWENSLTDEDWENSNSVTLRQAQRNYAEFGAAEQAFMRDVREPTAEERREAGWKTIDERQSEARRRLRAMIDAAFADVPRPREFTNANHCEECAEHNELMASRDRETLRIEDVENLCWNPIPFLTPSGFRYYFPALVRLALAEEDNSFLSDFMTCHLRLSPGKRHTAFDLGQAEGALELFRTIRAEFAVELEHHMATPKVLERVEQEWVGFIQQLRCFQSASEE